MRAITPKDLPAPLANYSHGIEVPPGARLLFVAGQLGIGPDGNPPEDAAAQADLCFEAIGAILRAAGMDFSNLVRLNAYVTDRAHMKGYMAARDRHVSSPPPASTLVIVSGFTRPEFKVEVEAVAAKVE